MLIYLASLLVSVPARAPSEPRPIAQLVHTRWTTKDGAPNAIHALAQTPDGYIWLGTSAGLIRFDGVRFVPFVPRGSDTLPTVMSVQRMLVTRDGSLWVIWRLGGVSRLHDGRVTTYGEREGLPVVFQLAQSSDGMLVAGTANGLAQFANGKWEDVTTAWRYPGKESRAVWFDGKGALWAQTQDRIVYRPKGDSAFLDPGMRLKSWPFRADFAEARDGTIWMAELNRSAHTLRRVGEDSTIQTEVMVYPAALLIDRRGSLWIGSAGRGIRRVIDPALIRGKKVDGLGPEAERYTMKDGLLSDDPEALLEDREGNIWVGSSRGLERFREGAFTPYPVYGADRPRIVFTTRDSTLWTAAYLLTGVVRVDPRGRQDTIRTRFGVYSLAEDSLGRVWTVDHADILRFDGKQFTAIPLRRSNVSSLSNITIDRSGTIWVMNGDGRLLRLAGDSLIAVASLPEPVISRHALYSDRRGRIWVGQLNRVVRYDRGKLDTLGAAHGVRPGLVYDFFEDSTGKIWAASFGGLSRFDEGRFRTVSERQGIPGGSVFGLAQDSAGSWWLATRAGVIRIPRGEADRALADSTYVVASRGFDENDGVPGLVPAGYWGSILTRSIDGTVWVSTDSGVGVVDPGSLTPDPPPPALIEAARIDGKDVHVADGIEIPPGRHDIEIDYTTTSFIAPERMRFRYRLENADDTWHDAGSRRRAYYSGLAPGQYRFRVASTNGDGVWNETGTGWTFRQAPALYQTLWFRAGIVLLVGALGAAAAALVQRQRHQRSQATLRSQYEATLAERSRIAQDLHDTLLQGFAGVAMQLKAAELALPDEPDVAVETIQRMHQVARQSLREARERVWDMREVELGSEDLCSALDEFARSRTAGTGLDVSTRVAGKRRRLSRVVEDAAFRIGREAVTNSLKHAEARKIEIHFDFAPTSLRMEVRDDGRGLTPNAADEARRNGHFGLTGIQDRVAHAGGTCEIRPREGGGTVVAVELPVAKG